MAANQLILPALLAAPLVGSVVLVIAPLPARATRIVGIAFMGLVLGLALTVAALYDADGSNGTGATYQPGGLIQMTYAREWMTGWGVWLRLGVDGLSVPLVVLTAFLFTLAGLASWKIKEKVRGYWALMLAMEAGLLGTFVSLDLLLFFILFEVSLVPMYLLIGLWGGEGRQKAAIKFFIYTLLGSAGLLAGLVLIYQRTGSFDLIALAGPAGAALRESAVSGWALAVFVLLTVAFLVKLPAVPVHTWLADAHTEAPTAVSMLLAGVVLKTGGYGLIRVAMALFPQAAASMSFWLVGIGAISAVWAAMCAWGQRDLKRLVAFSSINHMGFVLMGLGSMTVWGWSGAVFMMIAHGLTSAAMFFVAGVVQDRIGHRELSRLGGIATTMPFFFGLGATVAFANMGLPGLCNFVAELMVLIGLVKVAAVEGGWWWGPAGLACLGTLIGAAYTLKALQQIFFGTPKPEGEGVRDLSLREQAVLVPLVLGCLLLGVVPSVALLWLTGPTVQAIISLGKVAAIGAGGAGAGGHP